MKHFARLINVIWQGLVLYCFYLISTGQTVNQPQIYAFWSLLFLYEMTDVARYLKKRNK